MIVEIDVIIGLPEDVAIFPLMMSLINSADLLIIILRRPTVVFYRGLTVWLTFLFLLTCCIFTFLLFSPLNKHLLKVGNVRIHHAKFIHGLDAMILAPSE